MQNPSKGYIYAPYIPLYVKPSIIDIEKFAEDFIDRSREIDAILDMIGEHLKANGLNSEIVYPRFRGYADAFLRVYAKNYSTKVWVIGKPAKLEIRVGEILHNCGHRYDVSVYDPDFLQKIVIFLLEQQRIESCR